MPESTKRDDRFTNELEDLLPLIEELKSVPRHRPRLMFELRMWLYTLLPAHGLKAVERSRDGRGLSIPRVHGTRGWMLRSAACAALACLLALGVFSGLVLAGRNSRPGDSLYFTKRVREKLELALTPGNTRKAEKEIAFARQKLSDLDYITGDSAQSAEVVASTISQYRENVRSVGRLLQASESIQVEEEVVASLEALKVEEKKVMDRVTAARPESVLAAAALARVEVRDASGRSVLGSGQKVASGVTDENGAFSFDALVDGSHPSDLEVTVDLDGRRASLPLFGEADTEPGAPIRVTISPESRVLDVMRPVTFTVTLTDTDGSALVEKEVRLRDRSQAGTIDGESGEVRLVTDAEGRIDFTFKKSSAARVSRLSARVLDGTWHELGDVLVIGGVESPRSTPSGSAVNAVTSTGKEGRAAIELDNGLVRLTVDGGNPGHVITGMTRYGGGHVLGPLVDPSFTSQCDGVMLDAGTRAEPVLFYADKDAAGYEISFDAPYGSGTGSRVYRVMLCRNESFVTVMCRDGNSLRAGASAGEKATGSTDVFTLEVPYDDARFEISGSAVRRPTGDEAPAVIPFVITDPLSLYEAGGVKMAFAIPAESLFFPDSWSLTSKGIGVRRAAAGGAGYWSITSIIGFTDGLKADGLLDKALGTREFSLPGYLADGTVEGAFLVTTSVDSGELKAGRQRVELNIYKAYETVLDAR